MLPRRFALVRHVDYTGISGVGVVAYGVVFPDGHVALRWASDYPATSLWHSIDDMLAVHGHGEATGVEWLDPKSDPFEPATTTTRGRRARRARQHTSGEPPSAPNSAPSPEADFSHDAASAAGPVNGGATPAGTVNHDAHATRSAEPARHLQSPPPPPARPAGPESRLPAQRRPGRHRRASAEQESESTLADRE